MPIIHYTEETAFLSGLTTYHGHQSQTEKHII